MQPSKRLRPTCGHTISSRPHRRAFAAERGGQRPKPLSSPWQPGGLAGSSRWSFRAPRGTTTGRTSGAESHPGAGAREPGPEIWRSVSRFQADRPKKRTGRKEPRISRITRIEAESPSGDLSGRSEEAIRPQSSVGRSPPIRAIRGIRGWTSVFRPRSAVFRGQSSVVSCHCPVQPHANFPIIFQKK
jgi:hypothetical protein